MILVQEQNRKSPRNSIEKALPAQISVDGKKFHGSIANYSLNGFGLTVDPRAVKRWEKVDWDVAIEYGDHHFMGGVRHHSVEGGRAFIGVKVAEDHSVKEFGFSNEDAGWDFIDNVETLKTLFSDLLIKGPEVLTTFRQMGGSARGFLVAVNGDGTFHFELSSLDRGKLTSGVVRAHFEIFQTCHGFESVIQAMDDRHIVVSIPKNAARLLRRETFRVQTTKEKWLKAFFRNSILGSSTAETYVFDYSEHGLGISEPTGKLQMPMGTPFDTVTIMTWDGRVIHGRGVVCGHRWEKEVSDFVVGVRFEANSFKDRTAWHNTILGSRYEGLDFDYNPSDHKPIWDLFHVSGYLGIMPPETTSHVFDITAKTWQTLSNAGTMISKRAMVKKSGKIVGHLQMDRIYPDTWCAHHLAIDPAISKVVGKELYSVTADVLSSEGARFILSITEKSKPWNQRSYYDFVAGYRFPEHNELRTFQVFEAKTTTPRDLPIKNGLETHVATKWDLKRIARFFELYSTPLERQACSLTSQDLDLSAFNEELAEKGLERKRHFVVGTWNDKMVGFARVEVGTVGVNVFGLLDTLYVHVLPSLGPEKGDITSSLVEAGLRLFSDLEREDVLVLLDDERPDYYDRRGVKFIWDGVRWIARCETARRYHSYTQMLYGHLLLKREKIHKTIRKE